MNALIIVTLALSGPMTPCEAPSLETPAVICTNQAALAAFDGPASALALGAGDALGSQIFAVEIMARSEQQYQGIASAE